SEPSPDLAWSGDGIARANPSYAREASRRPSVWPRRRVRSRCTHDKFYLMSSQVSELTDSIGSSSCDASLLDSLHGTHSSHDRTVQHQRPGSARDPQLAGPADEGNGAAVAQRGGQRCHRGRALLVPASSADDRSPGP